MPKLIKILLPIIFVLMACFVCIPNGSYVVYFYVVFCSIGASIAIELIFSNGTKMNHKDRKEIINRIETDLNTIFFDDETSSSFMKTEMEDIIEMLEKICEKKIDTEYSDEWFAIMLMLFSIRNPWYIGGNDWDKVVKILMPSNQTRKGGIS